MMQQLSTIEILVLNIYYVTQHLNTTWHPLWIHLASNKFTDARHILHFLFSAPDVCSAPTDCLAPKRFYSTHTRFSICSALTKNSARHELSCLKTTNEFSQALQTSLLQLILLMFLSVTNLYILEYVINTSFYQCLNWSLYFITIS